MRGSLSRSISRATHLIPPWAATCAALCLLALGAVTLVGAQRPQPSALDAYALDAGAAAQRMPGSLAEVSGLTVTNDGRVFAHADERAVISELDPATGDVVKSFMLGTIPITGDFEGIEFVEGRFLLVTSDGTLYEFREGGDGAAVDYEKIDTGLGGSCEIEGLSYEKRERRLLFACKTTTDHDPAGRLVASSWPPSAAQPADARRTTLPTGPLEDAGFKPTLHPSGIAVHPRTGTLFVIAARERLILELTSDGAVLGVRRLEKAHRQAEGIAFLDDGTMLIADERKNGGTLTRYPMSGGGTR